MRSMNLFKSAVMILTTMVCGGCSDLLSSLLCWFFNLKNHTQHYIGKEFFSTNTYQFLSFSNIFNITYRADSNMGMFRVLPVYLCIAVLLVGVFSSAGSTVLIRFNEAPPARSRFSTAVFRYSIVEPDGSSVCKNNGCSILCKVKMLSLLVCELYH